MIEYKKTLREHAETGSDQFINNSSMDHAAAMIEELFRNAQGTASIFTGHLEHQVYDRHELRQATVEFLKKEGNKLNIILQLKDEAEKESLNKNKFIALLKEFKEVVNIYEADSIKLKELKNHFMVVKTITGNYALRFELDIEKHIATGTFNGGELGKKLSNFFESSLTQGAAIPSTVLN